MTFSITEADQPLPDDITQALRQNGGLAALAKRITDRIHQGLESGSWITVDGKALPAGTLQFSCEGGIITPASETERDA